MTERDEIDEGWSEIINEAGSEALTVARYLRRRIEEAPEAERTALAARFTKLQAARAQRAVPAAARMLDRSRHNPMDRERFEKAIGKELDALTAGEFIQGSHDDKAWSLFSHLAEMHAAFEALMQFAAEDFSSDPYQDLKSYVRGHYDSAPDEFDELK